MTYFVYLLECNDGTYYTGIAKDVAKRLQEHNESVKGARYTRGRRPVQLVYSELARDRSCAQVREAQIRRLPKAQKTELAAQWKPGAISRNSKS